MLNNTIPGGAFLSSDGETWHNANGEKLSKEAAAEAKRLHDEQQAAIDAADVLVLRQQANQDPVARALSGLLQQQTAKPASK